MAKTKNRDRVIEYLQTVISANCAGLSDIPGLIKKVIEEELWRERLIASTKKLVYFMSFREFVEAPTPQGLGTDLKTLQKLCSADPAVIDLIDRMQERLQPGGDRRSADFKSSPTPVEISILGNSLTYALRKLRNQFPDLHQSILVGETTANQAMIAAGLKQKSIYITRDVAKASRTLRKHFTLEEIKLLIKHLSL